MSFRTRLFIAMCGLTIAGCATKPPAQVSRDELASVRESYGNLRPGATRRDVLASFQAGNKVKLGTSSVEGASIEEWKIEAFHDQDKRKDIFVTFLYFCDERLVDSSDTRIMYRERPELIDRWRSVP